jgi:hypothetical protein
MRQVKEWTLVNGGAPAVVLVGVALLTQAPVPGLVVLGLGIIWFVSWLDPVRKHLIAFLEFPDRRVSVLDSTESTTKDAPTEQSIPLSVLPPGSEVTIKLPEANASQEEEVSES